MNATELNKLAQDVVRFRAEHYAKWGDPGVARCDQFRVEVLAALEQAEWIERALDAAN